MNPLQSLLQHLDGLRQALQQHLPQPQHSQPQPQRPQSQGPTPPQAPLHLSPSIILHMPTVDEPDYTTRSPQVQAQINKNPNPQYRAHPVMTIPNATPTGRGTSPANPPILSI